MAGPWDRGPRPARQPELRLYGLNAVDAVFRHRPQAIRKVYLLQSRIHALKPLLAWCVQQRVGYRVVEEADLDRLAASSHHEGVVADVLNAEPLSLDAWLEALATIVATGLLLPGVQANAIADSASNTAVAAATLRLSTAPLPGIDRRRSQAVASAGSMPSPSAPMM